MSKRTSSHTIRVHSASGSRIAKQIDELCVAIEEEMKKEPSCVKSAILTRNGKTILKTPKLHRVRTKKKLSKELLDMIPFFRTALEEYCIDQVEGEFTLNVIGIVSALKQKLGHEYQSVADVIGIGEELEIEYDSMKKAVENAKLRGYCEEVHPDNGKFIKNTQLGIDHAREHRQKRRVIDEQVELGFSLGDLLNVTPAPNLALEIS